MIDRTNDEIKPRSHRPQGPRPPHHTGGRGGKGY